MEARNQLEEFAGRFVLASFRERFVYEALRKPCKLHERICHQMDSVFPPRYLGGKPQFNSDDAVFPIVGTDFDGTECRWEQIEPKAGTGCGLLVASADFSRFYAETESEFGSPFVIFSSDS